MHAVKHFFKKKIKIFSSKKPSNHAGLRVSTKVPKFFIKNFSEKNKPPPEGGVLHGASYKKYFNVFQKFFIFIIDNTS
jgi:hypothetical protein